MPTRHLTACLAILLIGCTLHAAPQPQEPHRTTTSFGDVVSTGAITARGTAAAKVDTVLLFGGPGSGDGKFQDASGFTPDWEGWTRVDNTQSDALWQTSLLHSPTGTQAAWCGRDYTPCDLVDPAAGYGNHWDTSLVWEGAVADPGQSTDLAVSYALRYETEPTYDFVTLEVDRGGVWTVERSYDGHQTSTLYESVNLTVAPADLDGNLIRLRLRFVSDGAYSDADCNFPTAAGACQVDDFAVSGTNGVLATLDDFEGGLEDGTLRVVNQSGKGNFSKLWAYLDEIDPCVTDVTPVVAFIDDGVVEPCTGGTMGVTWLYGPGGYCVNVTGGCAGAAAGSGIDNMIVSPPIDLAGAGGGLLLEYDAYLHLPIANGVFHYFQARTSSDDGVTWGPWSDLPLLYIGDGAAWERRAERLDAAVPAGATHLQVALGIVHIDLGWGFEPDPTPAPYLDNVVVRAFPVTGPTIRARELWMVQDAFPAHGGLDLEDLGSNDVPVDMALDRIGNLATTIVPGDSLIFEVTSQRFGAQLVEPPCLHYLVDANPLFDPYRTHAMSGMVTGDTVKVNGAPLANRWSFDLPDEDFLYPGDIMHYYVEASDDDGITVETSTMPEDLSAFASFPDLAPYAPDPGYLNWDPRFAVHALPHIWGASGSQNRVLIWNDGLDREEQLELGEQLADLCASLGGGVLDLYVTRDAGATNVHNGLGSRATAAQLAGYDLILYLSGRRARTLGAGELNVGDKSPDVQLLSSYVAAGGKVAAFSENLAEDLQAASAVGAAFLADVVGVDYLGASAVPFIGGQVAPILVSVTTDYPFDDLEFVHYGGCPEITDADAVATLAGTERVLAWTSPDGTVEPFLSAGSVRENAESGGLAYFPWPLLTAVYSPFNPQPPYNGPMPVALLGLMMDWAGVFGELGCPGGVEDETPLAFSVGAYPNPFNPEVTLTFTAPRDARALINIYDVRGAKVRTLLDARVIAGPHETAWDGRDDRGEAQASGVYFARVQVGEERKVEKLALIR